MSLKNVGDVLRQERMRQGLSLADVAGISKISPHTLEALEEGDISALPHHVYAKGFVKTYASILKIDVSKLGEEVDQAYAEFGEEVPERSPLISQPFITPERKPPAAGGRLLLVVILLGLVGLAIWFGLSYFPDQGANDVGPNDVSGAADTRQSLVFPGSGEQAGDSQSEYAEFLDQGQGADNATDELDEAVEETAEQSEASPGQGVQGDGHLLEVVAVGDCWLRAVMDGDNATEALLSAGQRIDLPFVRTLEVKFGNVAGVQLRYDGENVSVNASEGTAKTLTFPPGE